MTNLQKFIEKAREIEAKATPGPFHVAGLEPVWVYSHFHKNACPDGSVIANCGHTMVTPPAECRANAQLFAFSRNNFTRLLNALERQDRALEHIVHGNPTEKVVTEWYSTAREALSDVERILGSES